MLRSIKSTLKPHKKWLVLILISTALFLVGIDMTVLYTALPSLTHDLNVSNIQKLWIINAYPLVMAGLLPGFGTLGDRIGHRKIFIGGLIVFGLTSFVMAFSPSANFLIAGRACLAVGAAMMSPATLALLRQTFLTDKERALAIGIWGSVASGAAAFGPLIGGALLTRFWWGSVFLINVPIVLLALVFSFILLDKTPRNADRTWDFINSVLIMIGIVGLIYALKEFMKADSDTIHATISLVIGILFTVLFVKRQNKSVSPMIDFGLFKNLQFSGGVAVIIVSMLGLLGVEFALTQHLQLVQDYAPLEAGAILIPFFVASFIAGPLMGVFLPRIGVMHSLWISVLVVAIGLVVLAYNHYGITMMQIVGLMLIGVGIGASMAAASSAVMLNAPESKAGMAASIETVSYELGGALGIAIIGSVISFIYSESILLPQGIVDVDLAKDSIDQALLLSESLDVDMAKGLIESAKGAFDEAFQIAIFLIAGLMTVLGFTISCSLWMSKIRLKKN